MSLGLLGDDVDPPKAVLYFADTMRNNPGNLYLDLFPTSSVINQSHGDLPQETNLLDGVIQEASAHGIRFYPVEAQGITAPYDIGVPSLAGSYNATLNQMSTRSGVQDAQGTLTSLALETGGAAFLNGVGSEKIVSGCRRSPLHLLISFDPTGSEDRPLGVFVRVHKENVKSVVRGELVIQSASASRTSRLLAAFAAPDALLSEVAMRTTVIPTGWADDGFTALVQVAVSARDVPATTWDVGTSLVSRERVRDEGSGRITVSVPGVPVVFEREVKFSSGPYELVSVAQEVQLGQVGSRRDEGSWPDLDAIDMMVSPSRWSAGERRVPQNGRSATRRTRVSRILS
jgi:hypothetical protein